RVVPPFGCTSTIGARQVAGSVTCWRILASPSAEIGTWPVVKAGIIVASAPQNRDAEIVVTGVAVPVDVITSPFTRSSNLPLREILTEPLSRLHETLPGETVWKGGSVVWLGASDERRTSPPWLSSPRPWR